MDERNEMMGFFVMMIIGAALVYGVRYCLGDAAVISQVSSMSPWAGAHVNTPATNT